MLAGDTLSQELAAVDARLETIDNILKQQDPRDGIWRFEDNIELREEAGGLWLHELETALLNGHYRMVPVGRPVDACLPCGQDSRCVDDVLQKPEVERISHTKEGRMLVGLEHGWKWTLLPLEIHRVRTGWVSRCLEHPEDSHIDLRVCFDSHVDSAHHFKGTVTGCSI
jgi:hypothetical protein